MELADRPLRPFQMNLAALISGFESNVSKGANSCGL